MDAVVTVHRVNELAWPESGLLPVVTQDADSGEVLMLAWANREALQATLATGMAHYYSRSRQELWRKGATSGHEQPLVEVRVDCDADALLYRVRPKGPACHTGRRSCFHAGLQAADGEAGSGTPVVPADAWGTLQRVVDARLLEAREGSYVARLQARGEGYVAQKVVEEAGEAVVAALTAADEELPGEAADLIFHLTVLLRMRGVALADVAAVLLARHAQRSAPAED